MNSYVVHSLAALCAKIKKRPLCLMYACNKIPLLFLITWVKVKWNLGAFCVTWRDFTHGRSLVRSSRPPDSLTPQINMSDSPWRSPRSARCASPARHESPLRGTPWSRTAPRAAWSDCHWTPSSPGTCEATAGAPPRAAGIRCKPPEAAYLGRKGPEMLLAKKESDKTEAWISQQTHPDCD